MDKHRAYTVDLNIVRIKKVLEMIAMECLEDFSSKKDIRDIFKAIDKIDEKVFLDN